MWGPFVEPNNRLALFEIHDARKDSVQSRADKCKVEQAEKAMDREVYSYERIHN